MSCYRTSFTVTGELGQKWGSQSWWQLTNQIVGYGGVEPTKICVVPLNQPRTSGTKTRCHPHLSHKHWNQRYSLIMADSSKSITDKATETATKVASTVQDTAISAKDNVFSMFGGGPKRETKKEEEDDNDRSGSAKAQKKDAEVSQCSVGWCSVLTVVVVVVVGRGQPRRTWARCSLWARSPSYRESRHPHKRRIRGAGVQDESQALQIRSG